MATVVITMNVMPESPETDLKAIEEKTRKLIKEFAHLNNIKVEIEPVAFGLKALKIFFVMDESKGSTQILEEKIAKISDVASVEVVDVRRAIG